MPAYESVSDWGTKQGGTHSITEHLYLDTCWHITNSGPVLTDAKWDLPMTHSDPDSCCVAC